jgi:phosphoribosylamine---glycine ligase
MRILFVSDILLTGDFVLRLKDEGHDVKLYIEDDRCKNYLDKLVQKTDNWKKELTWVGKDGLIIFDDVGFGAIQDDLRKNGYTVFGGSEVAERTEIDRKFGNKIFAQYGLKTLPLLSFTTPKGAIDYIKKHPDPWVVKYSNGHGLKSFAFIGDRKDGSDVISVLENYKFYKINKNETITIQKRVYGVEIGVARYFNGNDWIGPIEYNIEHNHLFPGDGGPTVDEMGTLAWYSKDENEKLYKSVLEPLKNFLVKSNFRGDFDINCIVNTQGAFPIEATVRLGSPIIHLQEELHKCPWGDFLYAVAKGEKYDLEWREGFSIAASLVVPPFPYPHIDSGKAMLGVKIDIDKNLVKKGLPHIHFDEVASHNGSLEQLYIAGTWGNPMYVTGYGKNVTAARRQAYGMLDKIYIPRMFYRDDIGRKFVLEDFKKLKGWGYFSTLDSVV